MWIEPAPVNSGGAGWPCGGRENENAAFRNYADGSKARRISRTQQNRREHNRELPKRQVNKGARGAGNQSSMMPLGVSNRTDMMPGVPFGAVQATLTSSRSASTGVPSQSATRADEPAIVRPISLAVAS